MNVSDIVTRVQRQFGDESGVQITDADIYRWISDSQREVVMQHENLLQETALIASVAEQLEYDVPVDCFSIQHVMYRDSATADDSYFTLRFVPYSELAQVADGWSGDDYITGTPQLFSRGQTQGKIVLFPRPDAAYADAIKIIYSRYATDIVDSTTPIDLPEYYHQYVLEYCLMKAYEMDENWEAADRKAQYIQSTMNYNSHRESWFGRETYPVVVPMAEDYM